MNRLEHAGGEREHSPNCPNYWEMIADEIKAEGWSIGWTRQIDGTGRSEDGFIWQADAHRSDGRRFIARAENLAVAMAELQKMTLE